MTNAELISMVRSIAKHGADWRINEVLNRAADALERLMAEVDRKDKALQAWVNTWESRKEQYRKPKQNAALKYEQKPINQTDFDALVVNLGEEDNG